MPGGGRAEGGGERPQRARLKTRGNRPYQCAPTHGPYSERKMLWSGDGECRFARLLPANMSL